MTVENRYRETPSAADIQAQAGRFARELGESAQQVWLAGIGALARAQAEGSRFFEQLAEEGRAVGEGQGPAGENSAAARLEGLRQAVDGALGRATAKANEAWDSVGRAFEHRVQQALRQMDVPTREDLDALGARIDALTRELQLRTTVAPEPSVPPTPGPAPAAGGPDPRPDAGIS
jgi:poly(hydroxyalkanoate) granule-associated protein